MSGLKLEPLEEYSWQNLNYLILIIILIIVKPRALMYHLIEHNLEAIFCQALFVFNLLIILNFLQSWYGSHTIGRIYSIWSSEKSCTKGFPAFKEPMNRAHPLYEWFL